jgi:long-chain acyl-CoA synthetase
MKTLLDQIAMHAVERPTAPALRDERVALDYESLLIEIEKIGSLVLDDRIGLLLDNGVHWACLDLALLRLGKVCVPMPGLFSNSQLTHLIRDSGLESVLTDNPVRVTELLNLKSAGVFTVAERTVWLFECQPTGMQNVRHPLPEATTKITYTSGTTGQPKGVCLSARTIERAIASLCEAVEAGIEDRAMSLLPLSTLLENIAGLYAPLWVGALAQIPSLACCGLAESSAVEPALLFNALAKYKPTTAILVPQLLKVCVHCIEAGMSIPESLRFVAVGGAPIPPTLLEHARELGLPVYQGYGLSEAGSVASLNTSITERIGSVGKPLPHLQISIAEDNEVVVSGNVFLGYLGGAEFASNARWHTGDLGYLDADGFLFLTGRKRTAYATAYGRNVSPEWVESELTAHPHIAQAAVFGEGQAINVAVLVPVENVTERALGAALDCINSRLPNYARVRSWIIADQPFSPINGLANSRGGIERVAVRRCYQRHIETLFLAEENHVVL